MSDVLGVSILVDAINHRLPAVATPSTVVGPFHIHDSPDFENGANMAVGAPGIPLVLTGTVRSLDGKPIPNAIVDVWQPDGEGVYEAQKPGQDGRVPARRLSHRQGRPVRRSNRGADRIHHPARRSGRRPGHADRRQPVPADARALRRVRRRLRAGHHAHLPQRRRASRRRRGVRREGSADRRLRRAEAWRGAERRADDDAVPARPTSISCSRRRACPTSV